MITLAKLYALARRIPGIAWVIAFAAVLLAALWFCGVHVGERRGEVRVQRQAVADSVVHVQKQITVARATSDSIGRVATRVQVSADSGRVATRAIIAAHLDSTPPVVVQAVYAQFDRDSLAGVTHIAHEGALLAERPPVDTLDRLRVSQAAIGIPRPDSHWKAYVAGGALLGAGVVITFFHFAR